MAAVLLVVGFGLGWTSSWWWSIRIPSPLSPWLPSTNSKPLQVYSLPNLITRAYTTDPIRITAVLSKSTDFTTYLFAYTTTGRLMTGQLNWPTHTIAQSPPVIILIRGYVPPEIYQTGKGSQNVAAALAKKGNATLAPDFFGYGDSHPQPENSWEERLIKPVNIIELIKSLAAYAQIRVELSPVTNSATSSASSAAMSGNAATNAANLTANTPPPSASLVVDPSRLGIWAHSNGGQIALMVLEALGQPLPTVLWAPVTVPFPYSILFFGDELPDEGKAQRAWLAEFERDYNVFDFSLTQHLNRLVAPIQIHHGTADEAALKVWSDEFVDKLENENRHRPPDMVITYDYFIYDNADHNLRPSWSTAMARTEEFFQQHLLIK